MNTPVSKSTLLDLAKFDTPTICNAIELFDVRPRHVGYMNQEIQACFPKLPPMVGYALTSTFRSLAPARAGDAYGSLSDQVARFSELPGPPVMVFQDLDLPSQSATFGEVMCTIYKNFGAAGLITSGTGRDLDQVAVLDFPCFTNGTCCSHGWCHIPQINVPVVVGGIAVYPGDLLHGDVNGVTTIPIDIASAIPEACQGIADAEKVVLDYCKSGNISPKGLEAARKECGNMIATLSKKLKAK